MHRHDMKKLPATSITKIVCIIFAANRAKLNFIKEENIRS